MKNKKIILLFSHKLTNEQMQDAKNSFGIDEFIYLSDDLQKIWSNISPDLQTIQDILEPIKEFIKSNSNQNDVVLIQGDFGACFIMVNFCKDLGLKTLYATTKRISNEYEKDGKMIKKSIFEHRRFREYE